MQIIAINTNYKNFDLINCVADLLKTNDVNVFYNANSKDDFLKHVTLAAVALNKYSIQNMYYTNRYIKVPVMLIIGTPSLSMLSTNLIDNLQHDQIVFNTVHNVTSNWMLGSINSIIKVCISGNKLNNVLPDPDKIKGTPDRLFPLAWYAQRIGLKIYELPT